MFSSISPYIAGLKIAVFIAALVSAFFYGEKVQKAFDAESQQQAIAQERAKTQAVQEKADQAAAEFLKVRSASDQRAFLLRKRLGELNGKLSTCNGGVAALNGNFRLLYNSAIAAGTGTDRPEPAGTSSAPGISVSISPEQVVDVTIENGRRWKQCRDQLTSLIQAVSPK